MATITDLFELAQFHHQNGNHAQAEALYRQMLQADPQHLDALISLGNLLKVQGRLAEAADCYRQALAIESSHAGLHNNLGVALKDMGQLADAVSCYCQALRLDPSYTDALDNLAVALREQGELAKAGECCREALRIDPLHAKAHNTLGLVLHGLGQLAEAAASYRKALRLTPHRANVHNNLATVLLELGQTQDAEVCCRQALAIDPSYANAHINLGNALRAQGRLADAESSFRKALALNPANAEAHNGLGIILAEQKQFDEAAACYRQALARDPNHAGAYNNLGAVFVEQGKPDEAAECYRESLRINPRKIDARHNLTMALTQLGKLQEAREQNNEVLRVEPAYTAALWQRSWLRLLEGDFAGGWADYEQRWALPGKPKHPFPHPRWDGTRFLGKTVLVFTEQGLGDTIHFLRYLPMVKERGGTVLFGCQPALLKLCTGIAGVDRFVDAATVPAFDMQVPLLSLPGIFGTNLTNIPAPVPYLKADPALVDHWHKELAPLGGFKIGIAWQGSKLHLGDRYRSFPVSCFEPLACLYGVRLVSLQKGEGTEQLRDWEVGRISNPSTEEGKTGRIGNPSYKVLDLSERLDLAGAFLDTAAVMTNLDLVITLDSAIAHLAGALGVPVWVALPLTPDWRWLLKRSDSPWYPTMRLFRQSRFQEWSDVFEKMREALVERMQQRMKNEERRSKNEE